jgi:hypothetical protein
MKGVMLPLRSFAGSLALGATLAVLPLLVASCGAGEQTAVNAPKASGVDLDADAVLLLPPGVVVAVTVDARALYESRSFGGQLDALATALLPILSEAGVVPSRDIERVTFASYALQGADAVVVFRGKFDPPTIERAAGSVLAATPYSGRTMYTVANMGFTVLTPHTVLAGAGAGLRLALDRIRDGRVKDDLPPAMHDTLRTKDVAAAFAADFSASPLTALQGLPIPPWVAAVKGARGVVTLREPGVNVSASIAFEDPQHAAAGADAVRQFGSLINAVAMAGVIPKLHDFVASADGSSVQVAFAVDDASLRSLLEQLPHLLPQSKVPLRAASNPNSAPANTVKSDGAKPAAAQ